MMMHSVADVQGLNSITRAVLGNAASAMVGMVQAPAGGRPRRPPRRRRGPPSRSPCSASPRPCVQQITARAARPTTTASSSTPPASAGGRWRSWSTAAWSQGVIDVTTTEVADMLVGGIFPATEDRFGAIIRTRMPYVGSVGALDMVNFGAFETVPEKFRGRILYRHNPQITLMRTTPEENAAIGRWIGERLNQMDGAGALLPARGRRLRARCARASPSTTRRRTQALFRRWRRRVRPTATRQLIRAAAPHQRRRPSPPRWSRPSARCTARGRPQRRGRNEANDMPRSQPRRHPRKVPRHDRPRRADRRRRRRHRPLRQMRGGRRHRPHRHLQLRPLPHGRPRLARRPARLWRRQRDRAGHGRARCCRWSSTRRCSPASTPPTRSA